MKKTTYGSIALLVLTMQGSLLEGKEITTSLSERVALKKLSGYWEEQDRSMSEVAIRDFLLQYPQSGYCEQLYAMLGDLYFAQKNYPQAIEAYSQISEKEYKRKTYFHLLHSLYSANHHEEFLDSADLFLKDPYAKKEEIVTILFELAEVSYAQGQHAKEEGERKRFFEKALQSYQALLGSSFEKEILLPLAELYSFFQDYPKAAKTYLKLAEITPDREEEFLFHVASLQVLYDKKSALHTFDRVINLKGPLSKKAGYNLLALLFQMQRYSDVITASVYIDKQVPEDKVAMTQYYLGKSLFHEKDFEGAAEVLEDLLAKADSEEFQAQLIPTLLACAKEMQNLSLCDRITQTIGPEHSLFEHSLLLHARLSRLHKEWSVAREDLEQLLKIYPDHQEKEGLSYDIALLLMQEGKEDAAIEAFSSFLAEYPKSHYKKDALRNLLHLSSLQIKKGGEEAFAALLKNALSEEGYFSEKEEQEIRFLLGQTLLHLQKKQAAAEELTLFVNSYPEHPQTPVAYLLLANCHQHTDPLLYTSCLEKALALNPDLSQESKWHRLLFNAYLKLSESSLPAEKAKWLQCAANHLFKITDGSATQENQRWLADYYLKTEKDTSKAIAVLERLIHLGGKSPLLSVNTEAEVIRLSSLYRSRKEYDKATALLQKLVMEQKKHPDWEWKHMRMAQFELGTLYALLEKYDQAIDLYQELISSSSHLSSYFALAAKLELAKIKSTQLASLEKESQRKQISELCDILKEVEVKRQLVSEPLHIEAGLCYVDLKTQLAPPNLRSEKKSLLLAQVKKELTDFNQEIAQKEESSSGLEEKKALLASYLAYIDIQISSLQKEASLTKTKEELRNLISHVYNQTLQERLSKSLEELDHPL